MHELRDEMMSYVHLTRSVTFMSEISEPEVFRTKVLTDGSFKIKAYLNDESIFPPSWNLFLYFKC